MADVRLRSGRKVEIRPIRPDDGERLRVAYDQLSPRSQYLRFHAAKPHLSPAETRYLVDVDYSNHFALVATPDERSGEILAVARFVRLGEDPRSAEIAVVVGDPLQGEGLASEMLERLGHAALSRGIARFRATMLTENVPARKMLRGLSRGHARERHRGPFTEVEVDLVRAQPKPAQDLAYA